MKIVLTRINDNMKITVDSDLVMLVEPATGTEGTHIVFGPGLVRTVVETPSEINAALGAIVPSVAAALLKPRKK